MKRLALAIVLASTGCCIGGGTPPPSRSAVRPPAPPPSSPEQPIGSPGACRGDDRTGVPLATSDFVSTLPLEDARARLDDWNEWCPDTWCEGSFDWLAYDLRGDASRSEITMRAYARQRGELADVTDVDLMGAGYRVRVLSQHVVPSCIVPCLEEGVYAPDEPCLVLDVRFSLAQPVSPPVVGEVSAWEQTWIRAGGALEAAVRARIPEDLAD